MPVEQSKIDVARTKARLRFELSRTTTVTCLTQPPVVTVPAGLVTLSWSITMYVQTGYVWPSGPATRCTAEVGVIARPVGTAVVSVVGIGDVGFEATVACVTQFGVEVGFA
jgi:hypothetical protein